MKKTIFQDKNGDMSMNRYLTYHGFWFGIILSSCSFIMLVISFFFNKSEWSSIFLTLTITGLGLISASIAGKTIQTKFENGYHETVEE